MKSFIRTFLIAGVLGGIWFGWFGPYVGLIQDFSSIWSGIIAGLILGLAAAITTRFRQNRVADSDPLLADEKVLREGRATHEGMAGRLYLTDRRILFEGYLIDEAAPEITRLFEGDYADAPAHEVSIPIIQVVEAVASRPLGVGSSLKITLADGSTMHFGTEDLADWIETIATSRQMYLDQPRSEDKKLFP